ncbi:MAG: UbiA family prenyltransferase [Planctomycetota bacterium]
MIGPLLRLMRLYYSLPFSAGFLVILAYLRSGELAAIQREVAFSFFALFCVISAGYVFNDVRDVRIDKINCPHRVLAAGRVSGKVAVLWAGVLLMSGMAVAWLCNPFFFLGTGAIAAGLICYDLVSKRIGVFKDLFVALLTTSLYPLAFTLAEPVNTPRLNVLFIHPVWLLLSAAGYEMLKDIRDVEGDNRLRGDTLGYCQSRTFQIMARVLVLTGSLVTLVPFMLGYCHVVYLAASVAAILLAVLSTFRQPAAAMRYIYGEIFLVTAGSLADLWVFGP